MGLTLKLAKLENLHIEVKKFFGNFIMGLWGVGALLRVDYLDGGSGYPILKIVDLA